MSLALRTETVAARGALATVAVVIVVALGYSAGAWPGIALAAAGALLVLGILSIDIVLLPIAAFPAMLVLTRVGGALSVSDFVLFAATLCALLLVKMRAAPELRSLLWVVVGYQATLVPTLIRNPYSANYLEWLHELVLVGGSLIVGWAAGNAGKARLAVSLYVVPVAMLAAATCVLSAIHHFGPVELLGFQKNALGDVFAFAAVIAYARPGWLGWRVRSGNLVAVVCAVGTLACASRQGMISVAVGVAVVAVRGHVDRRRSRIILLAMVPLVVVAYVVTANQLTSGNRFNSANQRLTWFGQSFDIWHTSRWVGVGLRWWYTSRFGVSFQPPNAELEMLTSAGVLGLAGFVIASLVALRLLWRLDPRYGTLAFAIVAVRLVQGQLDLFWVASQSSLPWLVVGVTLGALSLERRTSRPGPSAPPQAGRPDRRAGPRRRSTLTATAP